MTELAARTLEVEGSKPQKADFFDQKLQKISTRIRARLHKIHSKKPAFFDDFDQDFANQELFNHGNICALVDEVKNAYVRFAHGLGINQKPPKSFRNIKKHTDKLSEELKGEMNC